ncbi:MAG TPA: ABC transporter permease, partial [Gemmatimonadaceae bacterium]|nr:ABC transporter permease [Gemmatimonadaceae bacterium]
MSWLTRLLRRDALERELDREMQFHLDAAVADHVRAGMSRDDAVRRARIDFGGPEQIKEATRDSRGTRWVEDFLHDCRFALRGMRRSPGFAIAAILTIAIGVGANTAVWSIMDALMRRALPIENPQELRAIKRVGIDNGSYLVSHPLMGQMQRALGSAAELAATGTVSRAYATIADRPEGVTALPVSGNFFSLLGVGAAAGRLITPDDDRTIGGSPVVVITETFWERRFGRDPSVIGRGIRVNGFPVTIVGVAQPGFGGLTVGNPVDLFAPLAMHHALRLRGSNQNSTGDNSQPWIPQRGISWLTLVTRADARDSARIAQTIAGPFRADLEIDLAQRDSATRAYAMQQRIALEPIPRGFSSLREQFRDPLRALLGGVALILLLTCANLAGLVLARGEARSHEMAIRSSLGALSGRLARQVTAESLTLAFIGGALGLVVARVVIDALLVMASTGTRAIPLEASLGG